MFFADSNHIKMIELLLATPFIDVNAKDDDNQSALFRAVRYRYFDLTKLLLSHGAVVDTSDDLLQYFNLVNDPWFISSELIRFLSLLLAHQSSPQQYYETMILPLVSAGQPHHHLQPQVADMMREINWQTRKHFLGFLDINSQTSTLTLTLAERNEQQCLGTLVVADMMAQMNRVIVEYI